MKTIDFLALLLLIVGGLNWLLIGLFKLNLVDNLFGVNSFIAKSVYIIVGLCAIYSISFLFRRNNFQDHYEVK